MNAGEPLAEGHLLDGRYRVKKVLGVGGMGRVYLSNDTRLANRPVAVKEMIVGEGIQEKKAIEDFTREANVLARLSHQGIPTLIDHFVENGRQYLVMEFVAGADLQRMLDKHGPGARLPEDKVLLWARQMLEVLDFLHGQNPPIIYRDLKPGNIMIDKHGRAMLIDFGIARFRPPGGRGTQIGSVGYAPPEQYLGKVEPRSDLYSLAATMHHLLTGRDPQLEPPFSFPPLRDLAPDVSVRTADGVMRALAQDLTKRPASAREMLRALPEPPPGTANSISGEFRADSRGLPSPLSQTATVVLPKSPSGPTPPARSAPKSYAPPRRRGAPGASGGARGAPASTMPTIVLSEPVSSPAATGEPAGRTGAPAIKKAIELGHRARDLIERGLKSGLSALTPAAPPASVSSTARTQELNRPAVSSASGSRPGSTADAAPADTGSRSSKSRWRGSAASTGARSDGLAPSKHPANGARATARLVSRGDTREFGIFGVRTVIGRSQDPTDELDIDLKHLVHGAERVSRRHAEIIQRGSNFFIRDLGSLNGTYIAGRGKLGRDQLYQLKDRDQVVLGDAILQFRRG